jgi:hypothetical protein
LFLRYGAKQFGTRQRCHIWLNWNDDENAPLMTLLAYILVGHKGGEGRDFDLRRVPGGSSRGAARFEAMMEQGASDPQGERPLPSVNDGATYHSLVERSSAQADLVILGVTLDALADKRDYVLTRYPSFGEVLFVIASEHVAIE